MEIKEIIEKLRAVVEDVKVSGGTDAVKAGPARARAIARLIALIRILNEEAENHLGSTK